MSLRPTILRSVIGDVWTRDACGGLDLKWDHDSGTIVVSDPHTGEETVTRVPEWDVYTSDTRAFVEAMDHAIVAALAAHRQPYARYPATSAADEMAYLS